MAKSRFSTNAFCLRVEQTASTLTHTHTHGYMREHAAEKKLTCHSVKHLTDEKKYLLFHLFFFIYFFYKKK